MNIHISDQQKSTQLTGDYYAAFTKEMNAKGWIYWHNAASGDVEISSFGSDVNIVHRLSNPTVGDVRACANDERWKIPVDTSAQDVIDRKQDRKIKRMRRKIRHLKRIIRQILESNQTQGEN